MQWSLARDFCFLIVSTRIYRSGTLKTDPLDRYGLNRYCTITECQYESRSRKTNKKTWWYCTGFCSSDFIRDKWECLCFELNAMACRRLYSVPGCICFGRGLSMSRHVLRYTRRALQIDLEQCKILNKYLSIGSYRLPCFWMNSFHYLILSGIIKWIYFFYWAQFQR